ncbi:MAG TPA: PQQ-binding-like beta-propeller repeat protein [Planctomycetota bacterium]|nr:PQQ-binding-like beta-propeller repeat protein [Planctomycetota bacterium]
MRTERQIGRLLVMLVLLAALPLSAAQVEIQLVVHDQPDTTVDKMERRRVITSPVSTPKGVEMQTIGVDVVCWARNITLNGKPIFERYHEGKYIDRLPIARADLQPGDHTLWPGNHVFSLAKDGSITSKSSELIISGGKVLVKCYPVTLQAYRANPEESELPRSMRTAQLPTMTVRESANNEAAAQKDGKAKALELVPVFEKFAPLSIWLPGNTAGKGYVVHPLGLTFHLGSGGITPVAEAGKEIAGIEIKRNSIDIPLFGFPVFTEKGSALIVSGVEQINWNQKVNPQLTNWYPRAEPYELKVSETAAPLKIDGDPRQLPIKSFRVDIPDPGNPAPRGLAVELEKRHFDAGGMLRARVQAVDSRRSAEAAIVSLDKDATPLARLQAYGSDSFTDLPARSTNGFVEATLPALPDGIYKLQIGIKPTGNDTPLTVDRWISIAKPGPAGIGIFTQRGRTAFVRGEDFWLGLGITGSSDSIAAGSPLEVNFVDARQQRIPILRQKLSSPLQDRDTLIVRLESEQSHGFAPGTYLIEARIGTMSARPLSITIVEDEPITHFTNLLTGKYNPQGEAYAEILRTSEGADGLARSLVEMGHNSFKGMAYDLNRVVRKSLDIEQVARERRELGPWESYYQPSGRDRFLDAAVRHRLRFYENLMTYNDTMLPRELKILEAISRYTSLEVASLRHSPAFKGVCLYDEIYSVADTGTPMSAQFLTAEELNYRAKHPGLTSADAMRALERFTSRPFGQRKAEDLQKFKTWPAFEDREWRDLSECMARAAKTVMPDSQNFVLQRFWGGNGGNLSPNGLPQDVFAPLDAAACVMYKDGGYGDRPVFAPMQADVMRVRDDLPVWTQLHTFHAPGIYGNHLLRQAFFAISQKIDGLTYFSIGAKHEAPESSDNRDAMHDISRKLCTRYGDLFMSLQRGYKKVAVYYSREADYLENKKPNKLTYACEGLWVACMRAGFPADYIYDDTLRAGRAIDYEVIFAPGFYYEDEAPPEILDALRKLVNAGKIVVVERSSKLPIEGVHRLDSELDEYDDMMGGAFPRHVDFESEMVWDQSEETTRLVRAFLTKHIKPAAIHDLLVGPDWLKRGQGEFLVIPNFAFTGFSGLHKTLYQAPNRPTLRFPKRPPVCYDMLEMKRAEVSADGEWMSLQADFRECPGKIFAFLPAEIAKLDLKTVAKAQTNSSIAYEITILDSAGQPIDSSFPIEIAIIDSKGSLLHEIYRAATPSYAGAYRIPANVATGSLKLKVRELISGKSAEAVIPLTSGDQPVARLDNSDVHISDAKLLQQMMNDKTPLVIALDADQTWCKSEATRLCEALNQRGRQARIETLDSILRLPADWNDKALVIDGSRLWRGDVVEPGLFVDAPLVLIGKRYDNRLIEALVHRGVLAQTPSSSFPGRGRGLLGCVHHAFSNQFDTATILANDEAGLRKAVDALLSYEKLSDTHPGRPIVKMPQPPAPAPLVTSATSGSEPQSFAAMMADLDHILALAVDASTGRILAGTFGYGHNLFCFSADGKQVWKQFLPDHDVYTAQWFDGGKRVVAATGEGNFLFLIDGLDGRVLRKMKTSEWPSFHYTEGAVRTHAQILVNTPLKQILVRGLTGIFALDFNGKKLWHYDRAEAIVAYPDNAEQTVAASFGNSAAVGPITLSADGKRIAYSESQIVGTTSVMNKLKDLWGHRPKIIDAATGQVLAENKDDGGSSTSGGSWWIHYPENSDEPVLGQGPLMQAMKVDGTLSAPQLSAKGKRLQDGSEIVCTPEGVSRIKQGSALWNVRDDRFWITELDTINAARTRLYRSSWDGWLRCYNLEDGKIVWQHALQTCARIHVVNGKDASQEEVIAGAKNGALIRFDASGKIIWQTRLREHHVAPEKDYPAYVAAARSRDADSSAEIFPVRTDTPGDYENVLRMGIEQLANGDFESTGNWQCESGEPKIDAPGHTLALPGADEGKALKLLSGQLVTQKLNRRIVPSATYLLEFMYCVEAPGAKLTAGALLKGSRDTLTASKFAGAAGVWQFGRLAVKTYDATQALEIGFEAEGGEVRVDKASLRAVRFPSANLLANSELHQIEPTFVKDIRVRYNRIPTTLRDKLMNRNHVSTYKQGESTTAQTFTQEEAFLQNGRLDDVGPQWTYMPDSIGISVTLKKPAHISHVVLYLNNATPQNVYQTIAVLANQLEVNDPSEKEKKAQKTTTGMPRLEAFVRGNQRRFVVVHFPKPILTDSIKILPGKHPGRKECITEVEVYGPLGGDAAVRTVSKDPLETPFFMSNAAHVPEALPPDVTGEFQALPSLRNVGPIFNGGAIAFDNLFAFGDPDGSVRSLKLLQSDPRVPPPAAGKGKPNQQQERPEEGPTWNLATITPTTTPAHYSGRLFVGCADGKLHAVADNGTYLWAFNTGGRIYSSPVPGGDDVYFGADDGRLYKIDVDSGALIWEFSTGGKIRGAPALADGRVLIASADGNLYAVSADSGLLVWKAPIARQSRCTPAVHAGNIYIGDEKGAVHCFNAANGSSRWKHSIEGYISQCPVVTSDGVFFVSESGAAIFVAPDGTVKWKRDLNSQATGQAIATQTQLLIPAEKGLIVLRRADGQPDERFVAPEIKAKVRSVYVHNSRLYLTTASATTEFRYPPRTYAVFGGGPVIWAPRQNKEGAK